MVMCAVAGCKNESRKSKEISFLRFPKDEKLAALWAAATKRDDGFNITSSRVCSDHFDKSDFELNYKKQLLNSDSSGLRLKKGIVPHLNLPIVNSEKPKKRKHSVDIQRPKMKKEHSVDSDEDDVPLIKRREMPSKKRLTRLEERLQKEAQKLKSQLEKELAPKRGSGEPLQLQCWEEELSSAQLSRQSKVEKEFKDITNKMDQSIKQCNGELVYKGDLVQTYQIGNAIPPNITLPSTKGQQGYQLVMDPRLGLIVGTVTSNPVTPPSSKTSSHKTQAVEPIPPLAPMTRSSAKKNTRSSSNASVPVPITPAPATRSTRHQQQRTQTTPTAIQNSNNTRPTEGTAVGGLATGKPAPLVDLTSDDGRPAADSREVSFNKLQGKTFPSLVVVARPHLKAKEIASINDRPTLDAKVKSVLMHTPTKFTEWLIQQGLIRSEQTCNVHQNSKLKLGMYSDVSKFPYSGGYVWISECCPQRFVSVFSGSLFEGASHPPSVLLKLIYHWACQTNVQNIVQWVKVDNFYIKGLFTLLRAACTTSLHQHVTLMGGAGKRIEVGVISLGTTSQDGNQRQVKVEVLGILDTEAKQIRLRAVEPLADGDRNYKRRFSKILEPLQNWVHKDSVILTDLTVDKSCLLSLGFNYVTQSSPGSNVASSNQNVMEYLRRIVPRMFQNTLSLLSRQIIQQFLDELVWREWFGPTAAQAFDNIVSHIAEQTRTNISETLIVRLNKIASNPFKVGTICPDNKIDTTMPLGKRGRKRLSAPPPAPEPKQLRRQITQSPTAVIDLDDEPPEPTGDLASHYYGSLPGNDALSLAQKIAINVKCCVCKLNFTNNIKLLDHLLAHAHSAVGTTPGAAQCRFCLAMLPNLSALEQHAEEAHPRDPNSHTLCIICEMKFSTKSQLTRHLSNTHVASEMPYECGTCHHRTSSHRVAVEHFYIEHAGTAMLQCPFCLKSISVWSNGRAYPPNITFFMSHLQKHQKKTTAKKCNKCALWFVHKGTLKEHQTKSHQTWSSKSRSIMRLVSSNTSPAVCPGSEIGSYSAPQSPVPSEPSSEVDQGKPYNVNAPEGLKCKECTNDVTESNHFTGVQSCSKCNYITSCAFALDVHVANCIGNSESASSCKLNDLMYCICGYSSSCGNTLAKHLSLCERKSAYPSVESAQAATVTHSMLDVLGLVRRPEEPEVKSTDDELKLTNFKTESSEISIEPEIIQSDNFTKTETVSPNPQQVEDNVIESSETEKSVVELDDSNVSEKEQVEVVPDIDVRSSETLKEIESTDKAEIEEGINETNEERISEKAETANEEMNLDISEVINEGAEKSEDLVKTVEDSADVIEDRANVIEDNDKTEIEENAVTDANLNTTEIEKDITFEETEKVVLEKADDVQEKEKEIVEAEKEESPVPDIQIPDLEKESNIEESNVEMQSVEMENDIMAPIDETIAQIANDLLPPPEPMDTDMDPVVPMDDSVNLDNVADSLMDVDEPI